MLQPAWPDQPKMQLDSVYEPVVLGQRLFVGSSHDDSLTAYDTRSGRELWRFHANGPIRFAPVAWGERVCVASDDGYLYCLDAVKGSLVWKFRGGPSERRILGNERLISTWPARGAPVFADGVIYFGAGIWPFMGVFLHAVDGETGRAVWTNDGDGSMYIKQPHNADSFAGVAPQGPLVVIGSRLLVPGGRSVPACYDRATGAFQYYQLAENGKKGGGSFVSAAEPLMFNGGAAFDLATEKHLGPIGSLFTFDDGRLYDADGDDLRVRDLASSKIESVETVDRKGVKTTASKWILEEIAEIDIPPLTALIKAGSRLYGATDGELLAIESPGGPRAGTGKRPVVAWRTALSGEVASLIAGDDRLFAVTRSGRIVCFASDTGANPAASPVAASVAAPDGPVPAGNLAPTLLPESLKRAEGYALAWGVESGRLLLERSVVTSTSGSLRWIVIESDAARATAFRGELWQRSIPAGRMAVLLADAATKLSWKTLSLPPYFASVAVAASGPAEADQDSAHLDSADRIETLYHALRPYGGAAYLANAVARRGAIEELAAQCSLEQAQFSVDGDWLVMTRVGALPGSANWTHEHADAANSRVSQDKRVKAPLGLLWFGGSTNDGILPRHGHGPQPQVVDGRLFIEGTDMLRAMDIYTGRVLWSTPLPGIGELYNNTLHQPGANASGSNYVATPDGVYVAYRDACLRLDPATGRVLGKFQMPPAAMGGRAPLWGYLNVFEDYLIGGAEPVFDPELLARAIQSNKLNGGKSDGDDDRKSDRDNKATRGTPGAGTAPASTAPAGTPPVSTAGGAGSALGNLAGIVKSWSAKDNDNYSSSGRLVVMDRRTGAVIWSAPARSGFRHNGVCIGGGRLYCIDRLSGPQVSKLKRRGENPPFPPRIVAFDLRTGRELWSVEKEVFGTWLSYSIERDVLVEAGRIAGDTLSDEPKGMRAYQAASGTALWTNMALSGPAMIHHDTILMAGSACDLRTGAPRMRAHPLSGELVPWNWSRNYGCNTPMASEHLLTFRSGAAGYFDLLNDGGTGNFGGFRSSCTNNLVVAGGILTAPDYTRTCVCTYQNQTSIALVPVDDAEVWTSFGSQTPKEALRRVGVNFGAPGDRKAADGTLWLEYPSVGGASPVLDIAIQPAKPTWYRRHRSAIVTGDSASQIGDSQAIASQASVSQTNASQTSDKEKLHGIDWVAASGVEGLRSLEWKVGPKDSEPRRYTIRLHFAELADAAPGDRVFSVKLNGDAPEKPDVKPDVQLGEIDVVREAGGTGRMLVKEVRGVMIGERLRLELSPAESSKLPAILSGLELQQEK
ncbi:MAG: PQQ-binding-like beta-propeller repeat protein [Planctomycetota bacterium]